MARRIVINALAVAVLTVGLVTGPLVADAPAEAATGSPSSPANRSPNPVLQKNSKGYGIQQGGKSRKRVRVTDHRAASWGSRVTSTGKTTRISEPKVAVSAGQGWTFASDVKARSGAVAQVTVSWYSKSGKFLSWSGGGTVKVSSSRWTRVAAVLSAPKGATTAQTVVNVHKSKKSAHVIVTQHDVRATATGGPVPEPTSSATRTNLPGQPAITAYGSSSAVTPFARPGALIVVGRDNFDEKPVTRAAAAGATVLVYLDAVIDNPHGRYHKLLVNTSVCGPATKRWPGTPKVNAWGHLQDFRVGSVAQNKLECVLEKIVAENPHIGGFFADDLGSRSWFPGLNWDGWGRTNQQAYRDGAIALAKTFHKVAAKHGLMVMVNGTWTAGSLASSGGGYPAMGSHGLSLADGGYIEHHDADAVSFWAAYAKGQWATAAGSAGHGKPFMYVQANDAATREAFHRAGVFAFLSAQRDYETATVWGASHPTGLPTRVGG